MKKSRKFLLFFCGFALIINCISMLQNVQGTQIGIHSEILKPIIVLEKEQTLKQQIDEKSFPLEYEFCIHNYNEKEVNKVEFDYVIEIENSVDNFPVNYQLMDCETGQQIQLIDGKSEILHIQKSLKESRKFKLLFEWRELEKMADDLQIKLKINVIQRKE